MALPKGYIMQPCPNCGTNPHNPGYAKRRKDGERLALYQYVLRLRARKFSWREIGKAIGKSHEQARQIGRGL